MAVTVAASDYERFHVPIGGCDFLTQYAEIYLSRLRTARPCLENRARRRWPDLAIRTLATLKSNEECAIIGTVFRVRL